MINIINFIRQLNGLHIISKALFDTVAVFVALCSLWYALLVASVGYFQAILAVRAYALKCGLVALTLGHKGLLFRH